ncbi:MAG: hypothetical protein JRJ12_17770 [Deltaproteobacteria bacterium]|nr:hypothetical protein [Deltaproteobacteria bacterium]MBW2073099.1 hypothetical protein [Deltaproteobacteria bacterium]
MFSTHAMTVSLQQWQITATWRLTPKHSTATVLPRTTNDTADLQHSSNVYDTIDLYDQDGIWTTAEACNRGSWKPNNKVPPLPGMGAYDSCGNLQSTLSVKGLLIDTFI